MMRYLTAAAILALIAGCAQLEWVKPGMEPAARNEDQARCEQQARASASRMAPAYTPMPSVNVGPGGGVSMQTPSPAVPSDVAMEGDLLATCMQAKGYRLVPAKSAGGR